LPVGQNLYQRATVQHGLGGKVCHQAYALVLRARLMIPVLLSMDKGE
jgi:hypothetical protein